MRREGRGKATREQIFAQYWEKFGIVLEQKPSDFSAIFNRSAPTILEIGFGMGQSLLTQAYNNPHQNFIGVEVHQTGISSVLLELNRLGLQNVRLVCGDALDFLRDGVADNCLDALQIFFPDPWPKRRHHKRRLVQSASIELITKKLKPGGKIYMATDWADYAKHMLCVLENSPKLKNLAGEKNFMDRPDIRPVTKYELRAKTLGHAVWDLGFEVNSK